MTHPPSDWSTPPARTPSPDGTVPPPEGLTPTPWVPPLGPPQGPAQQPGPPPGWAPAPGGGAPPGAPGQWGPPAMWGPPPVWGPPPKPPMLPVEPREYPAFWRAPGIRAWRPVLVIILGAVGFFVSSIVVTIGALFLEAAITGARIEDGALGLMDGDITPTIFLANSVSLGLLVPLAFLLSRLMGQKGGWISSVVGRVRWGWLLKCFLVSFIAVGAFIVFSTTVDGWDQLELSARPGWWWLLIGIIIVTPFQAAGEEYLIRGVLNRGVASLIPPRAVGAILGAVISSGVFMLLHGAGDTWLNVTYFTMGMLFSYLTWRTGGLEASVAMHAANNLLALAFLPFQDMSDIFDREEGTGDPSVLLQLLLLGVAGVIIVVMARRASIVRSSAPGALQPSPGGVAPVFGGGPGLSSGSL